MRRRGLKSMKSCSGKKAARKLTRQFLPVGLDSFMFFYLSPVTGAKSRDYGGRNEIRRCRDALALCKLIIRMQIQSPGMYRLPPDS